jgi:hypothetical protein
MIRYMLSPKPVKEILRQVLLSLRLQWCPKPNIVHLLLAFSTIHLRKRIKLRLVFARDTQFPCQIILLAKVVPTFCHLIGCARIATSLVTRLIVILILPSRTRREMPIRGVFTILLWRKFL